MTKNEDAKTDDDTVYSYVSPGTDLERENMILKQTVSQLRTELDRYRSPALMVAEVVDVMDDNAVIKVPNGNKFYVDVSQSVENVMPGDAILVEQKNLTVVDK